MKRKMTISYEWWKLGCSPKTKIDPSHKGCLEDCAETRIKEAMPDGFASGILECDVNGVSYRGWWEVK